MCADDSKKVRNSITLRKIEIDWQGPIAYTSDCELKLKYTQNNEDNKAVDIDYGIYCIYGTHPVSGPDTLLYIGKACHKTFQTRIGQHEGWMNIECSELKIYIGGIGGVEAYYPKDYWTADIADAENMLIYYLSPPYNSSSVYLHPPVTEDGDVLIFNFGKRHRLPYCLTSAYYKSEYYKDKNSWKHLDYNTCSKSNTTHNLQNSIG